MRTQSRVAVSAAAALLAVQAFGAQTVITPPKNKYALKDDVRLGQEAGAQVEQQLPILRDDNVTSYVENLGQRLAQVIPADLRHPEFRYTFKVVNVREINAFALPGGPMYMNRGMLQAAKSEGQVAGVVAHEMSHVALRHGTAQQTKATPYAVGELAGAVLGAIIGGRTGNVISQGSQIGIGTAFLRFSREYEKQADLLGAQIMARAGYDPREMADMFKTIEQQGGPGVPQFMSDHPNPGNRIEYITREAQMLHVQNERRDARQFQDLQARLGRMSPAPSTEEATRNAGQRAPASAGDSRPGGVRVATPSSSWTTYNEGNLFRIAVPSNWRELPSNNSVTFAPEGAYGTVGKQRVFTHGIEVGVGRNETHDLQTATDELLQSLTQSNPRLGAPSGYQRATLGRQAGLTTTLSNVSDVTGGQERIAVFTTLMRDGALFYMFGVSPAEEFRQYEPVFRKVAGSVQFISVPQPITTRGSPLP